MFMMVVGKMIIIIIKITRGREGAFNNYVDQILPNFDPTSLEIWHIEYYSAVWTVNDVLSWSTPL